MFLLKQ